MSIRHWLANLLDAKYNRDESRELYAENCELKARNQELRERWARQVQVCTSLKAERDAALAKAATPQLGSDLHSSASQASACEPAQSNQPAALSNPNPVDVQEWRLTEKQVEDIVRQHFYPGPVAGSTARLTAALNEAMLTASPQTGGEQ